MFSLWCYSLILWFVTPWMPGAPVCLKTFIRCPQDSPPGQFRAVFQAEFLFDAVTIGTDGLDAEMQLPGNFPGGHSCPDETKDLELSIGQDVYC